MWYSSTASPIASFLEVISILDLPRSVDMIKKEIANMDQEFDKCQEVWSKGETNGFFKEELLVRT